MIAATIISSSSVNPPFACRLRLAVVCALFTKSSGKARLLPIRIVRPVERRSRCLAVHIEHILPPPGLRIGIVLRRPQAPILVSRQGVLGDFTKVSDLLI